MRGGTRYLYPPKMAFGTSLYKKVEVIPGISDHEAVFIESSLRPLKVKVPPRKVFMYLLHNNLYPDIIIIQ